MLIVSSRGLTFRHKNSYLPPQSVDSTTSGKYRFFATRRSRDNSFCTPNKLCKARDKNSVYRAKMFTSRRSKPCDVSMELNRIFRLNYLLGCFPLPRPWPFVNQCLDKAQRYSREISHKTEKTKNIWLA